MLLATLPAGASCIDVGASVGDVLQRLVHRFPAGQHLAFEPLPDLAADLARRFPAVDVRNAALSDVAGTAVFHRNRASPARSSLGTLGVASSGLEELEVRVDVLDDCLSDGYVPHLLKVDVEGNEAKVLAGARRLLAEHRPLVVFEHGWRAAAQLGSTPAEVHAPLAAAGLRVFDIDGGGPYGVKAFEARARDEELWTWIAVP